MSSGQLGRGPSQKPTSSRPGEKLALVPWCPSVVLDKLKQQPSATEQGSGRLSSSPPVDWDSPTARRSIRKAVNKSVDKKTKKLLSALTDELLSTKAQLTLAKLEKKKAFDALRAVQKKHKRGKKLMEEFRASEDCGAVVFSPSKVRKLLDLQKAREQAKEQQKVDMSLNRGCLATQCGRYYEKFVILHASRSPKSESLAGGKSDQQARATFVVRHVIWNDITALCEVAGCCQSSKSSASLYASWSRLTNSSGLLELNQVTRVIYDLR